MALAKACIKVTSDDGINANIGTGTTLVGSDIQGSHASLPSPTSPSSVTSTSTEMFPADGKDGDNFLGGNREFVVLYDYSVCKKWRHSPEDFKQIR
jgi:hypothetical protein